MKQKKIFIIYGLILSMAVLLVGGFFVAKTLLVKTDVDKSSLKVDEYYAIRNNATPLQKQLYKDLIAELKNNEEPALVYELLAQNFVADFYTWTNKFRRNDVGGVQFVDESIRVNVYQKAQDTLYNDLYYYINQKSSKDTLEVMELSVVDSKEIEYFIFNADGSEEIFDEVSERYVMGDYHSAYQVTLSWKYEKSSVLNPNDYDTQANIIMMKNDKDIPMIVEVNHHEAR